jgi:hypothetical protein
MPEAASAEATKNLLTKHACPEDGLAMAYRCTARALTEWPGVLCARPRCQHLGLPVRLEVCQTMAKMGQVASNWFNSFFCIRRDDD